MPYKRKYSRKRRSRKKRLYGRRRYRRRGNVMLRASIRTTGTPSRIVPDRLRTKMVYTTSLQLSQAAGILQTHVYRGNSTYDPDHTGVGGQPMGRDQLVTLYGQYKVYASKIIVNFANATTGQQFVNCAVTPAKGSGPLVSMEEMQEGNYGRSGYITEQQDKKTISNFMSTKKIYGVRQINDFEYASGSANNPVSEWFWHVGCNGQNGDNMTVNMRVKLIYYVEWYERIFLQTS